MAQILGVGIATLDIINSVDGFPAEDAEVRAIAQRVVRGGNAANTLAVLAQFGHRCELLAVLADEADGRRIRLLLEGEGVGSGLCPLLPGKAPTSYVSLNTRNGSRTIVHYRDLPELAEAHFARLGLAPFDWLHFEGRNVEATARMLARAAAERPELPRSLEVEKPRAGIEALFPRADLLFFSRAYAEHHGHLDPLAFLAAMARRAPQALLVCGWGADGAYGRGHDGVPLHAPALTPARLVDTLGAGDTLNAGVIHRLAAGDTLAEALSFGARLAGLKCGLEGFQGLAQVEAAHA